MQRKTPKVILLASSYVRGLGLAELLKEIGAPDWKSTAPTDSELLVEVAGRLCYKSFGTDLNPNVTKVREGNKEYIDNILHVGHGSVLEHASVTFAFMNVSRVFTHEMVRHRLCAFSQESLRYVRLTDLGAYWPDAFDKLQDPEINEKFVDVFQYLEETQKWLSDKLGLDKDDLNFTDKKKLTSAMRRLAPIGLTTNIMVTTNHRNWRHMLEMRTSEAAEEEIQEVMKVVGKELKTFFPNIYQDLDTNYGGLQKFKHGRV